MSTNYKISDGGLSSAGGTHRAHAPGKSRQEESHSCPAALAGGPWVAAARLGALNPSIPLAALWTTPRPASQGLPPMAGKRVGVEAAPKSFDREDYEPRATVLPES